MSYVRWSSVINSSMTPEEEIELYKAGNDWKTVHAKQLSNPGAYVSKWYIFWYSASEEESTKKSDQFLATWLAGEKRTATNDYDTVKSMFETDQWEALGYPDIPQKKLLRDCVKQWLDDVDKECE